MEVFYVGIDWGSEKHAVCVTDQEGRVRVERMLRNDGLFVAALKGLVGGEGAEARFAIEAKDLPIVEMMIDAGCTVFTINPKQTDRFRDRFGPSGAKDDRRDARVLASALRTDPAAFRRIEAEPAAQALVRLRARAVQDIEGPFRVGANQLRAVLFRYFPALLELCPGADQAWAWQLLQRASSPRAAAEVPLEELEALLRKRRVRKFTAARLHALLRAQPLVASDGVTRACAEEALRLVDRLVLLTAQKASAERLRDEAVAALRAEQAAASSVSDVELVESMPGVGGAIVATLFGEAGSLIRARDRRRLRAVSGIAPVTKSTGKSSGKLGHVEMRRSRARRLVDALFHATRVACIRDARFRGHYAELRKRGHSFGRALRGVADRYLDVLFALLRSRVPYDPGRLRGASAPAA